MREDFTIYDKEEAYKKVLDEFEKAMGMKDKAKAKKCYEWLSEYGCAPQLDEYDTEFLYGSHNVTESRLHRVIKESVRKVLREDYDKGNIYGYYVATLEGDEDEAYSLYDKLTHNEITVSDAITFITNGDYSRDNQSEPINPKSIFGKSNGYILTYDTYSGTFDVFEEA